MTDEPDNPNPLQPEPGSETDLDEAKKAYEEPDIVVSRGVEPLSLEEVDFESLDLPDRSNDPEEEENSYEMEIEPESDYVKSLDNCPNCGKNMGKIGNLLCLHCGYSLKTMSVIETKKGSVTVEELIEEKVKANPISVRGMGNFIAPGIMAGVSMFLLLIGYLIRTPGLIENIEQKRLVALVGGFGWLVPLIGSGIGAVYVLGMLLERKIGRFKLLAARVAGIVCMMRLATFISSPYGERVIEALLEGIIAFGAVMLFFKLKQRDALLLVLLGFANLILFYLVVRFFNWVM